MTLWTVAHQASLSMGILQARKLKWVAMSSSRIALFECVKKKKIQMGKIEDLTGFIQ